MKGYIVGIGQTGISIHSGYVLPHLSRAEFSVSI